MQDVPEENQIVAVEPKRKTLRGGEAPAPASSSAKGGVNCKCFSCGAKAKDSELPL